MDVRSGFLEDSKDRWLHTSQTEVYEKQLEEAAARTLPEPDSEPEVCPAPEPSMKLEQLWQSTVEALECRATWRQPSAGAGAGAAAAAGAAGFGVRQGYLALYGVSSELFQVDDARGVVRHRPPSCFQHGAVAPLEQRMLRDWAVSCSKCLRLKAVSEKLLKNSSLTSQALGGVLKELLQSFYSDLSRRIKGSPCSFIKLHVVSGSWLRRLQPVFVLCHVEDIDQELAAKMGASPPLPKLPQGIDLLEHIFRLCRVHEVSNCHFQACHRQLPVHLVPADMILLWIFQRSMQPFLDCVLTWTMATESASESIPKEFARSEGGKRKIRFPGFLSSVESDIQEMAHKLSILGLQLTPPSGPSAVLPLKPRGPVESLQPVTFFETQELQSQSFLGTQAAKEEDDWVSQRGERCLAVLCAMQEAQEAVEMATTSAMVDAAIDPALAGHTEVPTMLPVPAAPLTAVAAVPVLRNAESLQETKRKQDELRMALDAQVVENRALKAAAKQLDMEEEAKERALLGEPEDEMLLGDLRQQLLEEHQLQQRRVEEESLLLRWKLERLSVAEKLRQLYAFEAQAQALELQGFEAAPEAVARAAPRRIPVEEILSSWGPVVNPFEPVEQRSRESVPGDIADQDPPDLQIHAGQDDPSMDLDDLDDESQAHTDHLKDPQQLVQQVLRQIYSSCAQRLAEAVQEPTASPVVAAATQRPVLGLPRGYSLQISKDVMSVKHAGSRPIDAALESCLLRPLRQQSQWVDLQVVRKVLDLQLRRIEMLRRYMLMGESRLLEPFLTEAMMTYAAPKPSEASDVRLAEEALNLLFQSMVPRPTEPSDDHFLSAVTLHLATVPGPIGHGPVRLLDGIRFSLKLDFPMNLFFPERIMLQYSRLFRMIALVNHTLECLKGSWWFLASTSYGMRKSGGEMRRLAALRQGLHHFASTLHRYLLVAVVAAEFQRLEEKVRSASSLEGILMAHRACLGHCLAKAFLDTSRLEGAQDALAAVVGILDQALQLQCLLEEVAAHAPRSFPAWAYSRVHTIHGVFLDLRRSLQLCRPGGDGGDVDVFEEDFLEAWLLQWSRHCDQT